MAFGVLSKAMLTSFGDELFHTLIKNCVPKDRESDDAESRRQSVRSLLLVVKTIDIKNVSPAIRQEIIDTLYKGFEDYALDRRGDVGSWVRQEAMVSLNALIYLIVMSDTDEVRTSIGANHPAFFERFVSSYL